MSGFTWYYIIRNVRPFSKFIFYPFQTLRRSNYIMQSQYLIRGAPSLCRKEKGGAAVPSPSCSPLRRKLQYPRAFFNKGLFLNVSGHLKGYVGHFLPVGLEEGSTRPNVWCVMYCNSFHVFGGFYMLINVLLPIVTMVWSRALKWDHP